jgi:hypothetical protein
MAMSFCVSTKGVYESARERYFESEQSTEKAKAGCEKGRKEKGDKHSLSGKVTKTVEYGRQGSPCKKPIKLYK